MIWRFCWRKFLHKTHQLDNNNNNNNNIVSAYFWHMGQMTSAVCVDMESAAAFNMLSLNRRFSSYSDSIAFSVYSETSSHRGLVTDTQREREISSPSLVPRPL